MMTEFFLIFPPRLELIPGFGRYPYLSIGSRYLSELVLVRLGRPISFSSVESDGSSKVGVEPRFFASLVLSLLAFSIPLLHEPAYLLVWHIE